MTAHCDAQLSMLRGKVRVLAVLDAGVESGLSPFPGDLIHALTYLVDALAPLEEVPLLNADLIKRRHRPFFPDIQDAIDSLVGAGIITVESFGYTPDQAPRDGWRLSATYALNRAAAAVILNRVGTMPRMGPLLVFSREVVFAFAGMGRTDIGSIGDIDAAYSSDHVRFGDVIELAEKGARMNPTASVATRFSAFFGSPDERIDPVQLVHLYARHLYSWSEVA